MAINESTCYKCMHAPVCKFQQLQSELIELLRRETELTNCGPFSLCISCDNFQNIDGVEVMFL